MGGGGGNCAIMGMHKLAAKEGHNKKSPKKKHATHPAHAKAKKKAAPLHAPPLGGDGKHCTEIWPSNMGGVLDTGFTWSRTQQNWVSCQGVHAPAPPDVVRCSK